MLVALVTAASMALSPVPAVPAPNTLPPCAADDGSGPSVCLWDAQHNGNGQGTSYVMINGVQYNLPAFK